MLLLIILGQIFLPKKILIFQQVFHGSVTYTGFNGSGGYTIIIESENIRISYCHVSPNFLVKVGDSIERGQVLGQIGPFHVLDILNNPYKDKNGIPTNGATTGCHLHFSIKINGVPKDPLLLIPINEK